MFIIIWNKYSPTNIFEIENYLSLQEVIPNPVTIIHWNPLDYMLVMNESL